MPGLAPALVSGVNSLAATRREVLFIIVRLAATRRGVLFIIVRLAATRRGVLFIIVRLAATHWGAFSSYSRFFIFAI